MQSLCVFVSLSNCDKYIATFVPLPWFPPLLSHVGTHKKKESKSHIGFTFSMLLAEG